MHELYVQIGVWSVFFSLVSVLFLSALFSLYFALLECELKIRFACGDNMVKHYIAKNANTIIRRIIIYSFIWFCSAVVSILCVLCDQSLTHSIVTVLFLVFGKGVRVISTTHTSKKYARCVCCVHIQIRVFTIFSTNSTQMQWKRSSLIIQVCTSSSWSSLLLTLSLSLYSFVGRMCAYAHLLNTEI